MQVCFSSILKCKVLRLTEFKFGVSVLQIRCCLEKFVNAFVGWIEEFIFFLVFCKHRHNGDNGNTR